MKRMWLLATTIALMSSIYPAMTIGAADQAAVQAVSLEKYMTAPVPASTAVKKKTDSPKPVKVVDLDKLDKAGQAPSGPVKVKPGSIDKALLPIPFTPLDEAAFSVSGIQSGDTLQQVESVFGKPDTYTQSEHYTTLIYKNKQISMRVILRNDTADILKQPGNNRKAVRIGVESLFLTKSDDVTMGRNVRLGNSPEILVRQYGIPDKVLRDAEANVYYFVYISPDKNSMLVFAVRDRKVQRIAMMPPRPPYVTEAMPKLAPGTMTKQDFTLMGFGLEQPFEPNKYNMWVNMIPRNDSVFWLYGNYGMQIDRHKKIKRLFLMSNHAYTSRGATLGYHISTIFALYGMPNRYETGPNGSQYDDAYYYDSPYQQGASLVFVVKHDGGFVDDIILTDSPVKGIQSPMERYGLA